MGFRDIHAFNLVLLAKLAWMLIHQNHSLFFAKLQWKMANASLKFLGGMKRRRGKQSIDRRPLSSLAGTQAKLLKQISKAFLEHGLWRIVSPILVYLWWEANQRLTPLKIYRKG